ncbi:hypothetical protein BH23BAC1_BH23BAC1_07110 [soil metagenome]
MESFNLTQQEAQELEAFFIASFLSGDDFQNTTLIFNADGTFVIRENGTEVDTGTYSLQDNDTKLVLTSTDGA